MRITYNAPFVLSYTLICVSILIADRLTGSALIPGLFTVYPDMSFHNPVAWFRLVSHICGHVNAAHLMSNFVFILLLGPILEEKYGTKRLFIFVLITALVTGVLNIFFFNAGLLGASGVVFMMILLASFSNFREGEIPLTFILIIVLFLGQEFVNALSHDNISQFAHIIGGLCGSIFGFKTKPV
ncbi:MAG: rhomboid family intramembrane serine protease [Deferribacteres bacterium]|nr:rhomboid family intramembrane serine protease [candidate division KSB1 bacterium]MCB9501094.1 rhomboid family intramembrane serine protease [Deferribacteres bacterium]